MVSALRHFIFAEHLLHSHALRIGLSSDIVRRNEKLITVRIITEGKRWLLNSFTYCQVNLSRLEDE